ncbi:hypothetical protein DK847_01080 [Aestuariivirga litoralis]|uniref:N-acetyltransferase n=1 Tax=Aestuariivirga litoralis TaxID=2650924 RepID=A0A2W2AXG1_9HYPH|nr:hypothetical protein [Aestuariivirga litoralis]PZF78442.1 hypothetical protein DK847_01080 [Aestuariivirga litoralis]
MTQSVSVRPVRGKEDLKAFLDVPFALYAGDPNWVAPLYVERFEHLDPQKNPYFRHAEVELFLAFRGNRPVGRISAQLCRLRSERYQDGVGQFGFLEAENDPDVFAALIEAASAWLKQRGATAMQGPFSFSINDETGLLISGFGTPPSVMMGHALPYYAERLEAAGFRKAKDVIAYDFIEQGEMPRALKSAFDKATADKDVVLRPLDKKQLMKELQTVVSIANDAWSDNWGFVPWTEEEMTALANNLKMLVTGDYVAIAEYRGEPAAMAITLPNINDWIAGLGGKLLPLGWAKLAWNLFARPPAAVRMPLMGLRRKYHGTPVGAVLGMAVIARVRNYHVGRGTTRGEASWILEDNMPMRRMIESFGGKPYKTYRIYEKLIG